MMIHVSHDQFNAIVAEAVAAIPRQFKTHLDNVAFLVADEPSAAQLQAGDVTPGGDLLGLYEGIPLPERTDGYFGIVPDTITVFRRAHLESSSDEETLRAEIHQTVWHEVAHYFGLDHEQIHRLEAEARGNLGR